MIKMDLDDTFLKVFDLKYPFVTLFRIAVQNSPCQAQWSYSLNVLLSILHYLIYLYTYYYVTVHIVLFGVLYDFIANGLCHFQIQFSNSQAHPIPTYRTVHNQAKYPYAVLISPQANLDGLLSNSNLSYANELDIVLNSVFWTSNCVMLIE